jgi:Fic family protein
MKKPPYEITNRIVNLVADISAMLPVLLPKVSMQLRKECNVRSIYSSLAIENNSLSLEQVSDIVNGRRVIGPPSEIQEVKNAYNAYSQIETFQPYSVVDFCKAHKLMMKDLVASPGEFRHQGVGVYAGNVLIHAAPKAEFVNGHMKNLFDWAKSSDVHPLIKSSVVHYEIEFIHPFLDGNGRMGRLWQTVILSNWDSLFLSLPTETIVFKKQHDYYAVLAESDKEGSSTTFIEFMLSVIVESQKYRLTNKGKETLGQKLQ